MSTTDFRALLKGAKLPERSVPVCLRGDLAADHETAERELEQAQNSSADSLAGSGVGELVERIEALQAEMQQHTYDFRLRALPRPEFRALMASHPPRQLDDGGLDQDDASVGWNQATFTDALIRACTVDPLLDDTEWTDLLGSKLTDRQYVDLSNAAWFVNRGEVDVPFSRAASRAKRTSADE
jgi:uncharacterized small protein (DUF1192 family)